MKSLSILVADDDDSIRDLIRHCLTRAGHRVVAAASGDQALKLFKTQPFDLLVTDVLMPDGDGLNVIMGVRKVNSAVRILVISGGGKYFQAENCVKIAEGLGADYALFKPFVPQTLLAAVERAMATEPPKETRPSGTV